MPYRKWPDFSEFGTACWEHKQKGTKQGYGKTFYKMRQMTLHRASYWRYYGVEPGPVVMHTCDNPRCINPKHLVSGTQSENIRDCYDKGRGGHQRR